MVAVVAGTRVKGHARLLRMTEHQWALALGHAPANAPAARHDAVRDFVRSLEPLTPRFYEHRFHRPVDHEVAVVRKPGEAPVTLGQVVAVEALLEAGIGARFPLALRPRVRQALQGDAEQGPPTTRVGFRDTAATLQEALALAPEERARAMRSMGRRILDAILARAQEGYTPAVRFAFAWREGRRLSVGDEQDGLTTGDVAHLVELSAFLASVAADGEVTADAEARTRLHGRLVERWSGLSQDERDHLRAAGDNWAALRYAWDHAQPERRLVFRTAVAVRLTPADLQTQVFAEPPDPRRLHRWMAGRPREGLAAKLLEAAFDLGAAERDRLIDLLGVEDARAYHFGW